MSVKGSFDGHLRPHAPGAWLEPAIGSPAELEALVRRDIDKYRRIIALTGAKLE